MSQHPMRPESSGSIQIPYANGIEPTQSSVSGSTAEIGCSISPSLNEINAEMQNSKTKKKRRELTQSTVGSLLSSKQKTSEDKSKILRHPTLGFKYFLTRDQGSTSSGKGSKGFFVKSCADISERLWYPTETDCAELLSTSSNGYVTSTKLNSWFTTKIRKDPMRRNSWRTSWPSSTFSVPGSMEKDQISRGNAIQKSAKNMLVMKLLVVQLRILSVRREQNEHLVNMVIQSVNDRIETIKEYRQSLGRLSKTQEKQLETLTTSLDQFTRDAFHGDDAIDELLQIQDSLINQLAERLLTTDPHVKRAKKVRIVNIDSSHKSQLRRYMKSSRKIFNTAVDLHNKGFRGEELRRRCVRSKFINEDLRKTPEHIRQKAFDKFSSSRASCDSLNGHLAFISRNKDDQWVGLQKSDCVFSGTKLVVFGKLEIELKESVLEGKPRCDVEITESHGVFYATIMDIRNYNTPASPDISSIRICALDMGERTFGTMYDPDGTIAFLGTDANKRVKQRLRVIWKLRNGLKTKLITSKKRRVKKAVRRASAKLKNLIKDMHHRLANWLVQNYDVVLIGKLGIGVMKAKRKGKRVLQALSHYSFRRTLLQKASVNQTSVRVVSEAYTTKQCNQCGYMNWTIGSSEVFSCKNCKVVCHRDVHSGRGIFIRSMSE